MNPVEVSMQPALFTSHTGIRYGIAGSVWIEVPVDTTLDELSEYMVYKAREIAPAPGEKTWSVDGSKGNVYTVKLSEGAYSCTCAGFGFRRKCRHIKEIKTKTKQGIA
tara:strand:+ start:257 stop:580 length:324 start_codon:yes stop_codon:yes gene_type:complete